MNFNVFQEPAEAEEKYDSYVNSTGLNNHSEYIQYWRVEEGQSSLISFIKDLERGLKPLVFLQHRVWDSEAKNGIGGYAVLSCIANGNISNCPLCKVSNKPELINAWLISENLPAGPIVRLLSLNAKFNITKQFISFLQEMDLSKKILKVSRSGKKAYTMIPQEMEVPPFNPEQVIDLKEYFGMDDVRYQKMIRIASEIQAKNESKNNASRSSEFNQTTPISELKW